MLNRSVDNPSKPRPVLIMNSILAGLGLVFGGMGIGGLGSDNTTVALIGAWGTLLNAGATLAIGSYVQGLVVPFTDTAAYVTEVGTLVAGPAAAVTNGSQVKPIEAA